MDGRVMKQKPLWCVVVGGYVQNNFEGIPFLYKTLKEGLEDGNSRGVLKKIRFKNCTKNGG